MYYINKIVGWIVSPLGVLFIGCGVAWVLCLLSRRIETKAKVLRRVAKAIVVAVFAFVWVMGCGITTRFIGASLEKDWEVDGKPHGDISGLPNADAIVVLGGGMGAHPKCKAPEMFGAADRVWQGARLYKAGLAKLIAFSGPDVEVSTVPLAEDLGVSRETMMYFSDARNTEEESKYIFEKLSRGTNGNKPKILLVTSAWHMSRAKLLFERAGFDVVPAPTDFEMSYVLEQEITISDFFPQTDVLIRNYYAVKEWVGRFGYSWIRR